MYCLVSVNLWKCGSCLKLTVTYMIEDKTAHEVECKKNRQKFFYTNLKEQ